MATIQDQEKKPQIPDQLDHMRNQLSQLEKSIDDLRTHFQPVSGTPADVGESSSKDEEKLSDLANFIIWAAITAPRDVGSPKEK
jgi:hypothetical protein